MTEVFFLLICKEKHRRRAKRSRRTPWLGPEWQPSIQNDTIKYPVTPGYTYNFTMTLLFTSSAQKFLNQLCLLPINNTKFSYINCVKNIATHTNIISILRSCYQNSIFKKVKSLWVATPSQVNHRRRENDSPHPPPPNLLPTVCVTLTSIPSAPAIFHRGKKKKSISCIEGRLIFIITSLTSSPAKCSLQAPRDAAAGLADHRKS